MLPACSFISLAPVPAKSYNTLARILTGPAATGIVLEVSVMLGVLVNPAKRSKFDDDADTGGVGVFCFAATLGVKADEAATGCGSGAMGSSIT
jgi:hypothetical protein